MKVKIFNSTLEFFKYAPQNIADFENPEYYPTTPDPTATTITTTKTSILLEKIQSNNTTAGFVVKNLEAGKTYRFSYNSLVNSIAAEPGNIPSVIVYNVNNKDVLLNVSLQYEGGVESKTITMPSTFGKVVLNVSRKWNEDSVKADNIEIIEVV